VALGITMLMVENHRSGFVKEQFIKHPEAQKAMRLAGFRADKGLTLLRTKAIGGTILRGGSLLAA